jgi:D-alanyl-D-alanine carboxypeptidase-like protein
VTLSEKQRLFTKLIGQLIAWAYANGFELTFGEALRTKEQAALNAKNGVGIANSLHLIKLAIDLNLFIGGEYQTDSAKYKPLGDFWKSLHPSCAWGGDWGDGNHFSFSHQGVK